jgi:hypothetical protein
MSLLLLPKELHHHIDRYLPIKFSVALAATCHQLHDSRITSPSRLHQLLDASKTKSVLEVLKILVANDDLALCAELLDEVKNFDGLLDIIDTYVLTETVMVDCAERDRFSDDSDDDYYSEGSSYQSYECEEEVTIIHLNNRNNALIYVLERLVRAKLPLCPDKDSGCSYGYFEFISSDIDRVGYYLTDCFSVLESMVEPVTLQPRTVASLIHLAWHLGTLGRCGFIKRLDQETIRQVRLVLIDLDHSGYNNMVKDPTDEESARIVTNCCTRIKTKVELNKARAWFGQNQVQPWCRRCHPVPGDEELMRLYHTSN